MHCHGAPAGAVVRATEQVTPATPAARAAGWGTAPEPDTSPTGGRRSVPQCTADGRRVARFTPSSGASGG